MDSDFDILEERECFSCLYDLHLSAAGCECSPDRYSCLRHSKLFCPCGINKRFALFRYNVNELTTLVEALEGEPRAIEMWAKRNFEMVSANDEDACMFKSDMERVVCKTKSCEGKNSTCAETKEKSISNVPSSSPDSNVSSDLVHSQSHHQETFCAPYGTIDSHNDNNNDNKLVMDNEFKAKQAGSLDLNIGVKYDEHENCLLHNADNLHNKDVMYVDKVCNSEVRKERHNMELGANGVLSDSFPVLEKDFSSCSRDVKKSCTFDGWKLFGVDLQMHSDSGEEPNTVFKTGVVDTSNAIISLTDQRLQIQNFAAAIELISLGSVLYGKLWCSNHAIYPKGMVQ